MARNKMATEIPEDKQHWHMSRFEPAHYKIFRPIGEKNNPLPSQCLNNSTLTTPFSGMQSPMISTELLWKHICERRLGPLIKNQLAYQMHACAWNWNKREWEVNDMRTLRWTCGVTKKDKIRNEHVRGSVKVASLTKKIAERRLKRYEHVKRREEGHVLRRMLDAPVPGKRRRGRQTTRWKDSCKRDRESVGLKEEDVLDRTKCKNVIHKYSGDPRWWKKPEEKEK